MGIHEGTGENPTGLHLPWNRAQRRRHAQAKALIIHLFAGECSKEWVSGWPQGVEVITVDVRDGQNLHGTATWAYLWKLAGQGRVLGIFGGPPCRTVRSNLDLQDYGEEVVGIGLDLKSSLKPNNRKRIATQHFTSNNWGCTSMRKSPGMANIGLSGNT